MLLSWRSSWGGGLCLILKGQTGGGGGAWAALCLQTQLRGWSEGVGAQTRVENLRRAAGESFCPERIRWSRRPSCFDVFDLCPLLLLWSGPSPGLGRIRSFIPDALVPSGTRADGSKLTPDQSPFLLPASLISADVSAL